MEEAIRDEAYCLEVLRLLNRALETVSRRVEDRLRAKWPALVQDIRRQHPALFSASPSRMPELLSGSLPTQHPGRQPKTTGDMQKRPADALCSGAEAPGED